MLEQTLAYLGLQIAKFQFRSDIDQVQPMTEFFRKAENVLIMLPAVYDHAALAGQALSDFRTKLNYRHLTIVNVSTRESALSAFQRSEVIRIDPADLNKFSLPRKNLLRRILHVEYDVAIDLNLDFVLHTAYICKASHARIRVGFVRPASDLFFNVQLNLDMRRTPQAIYQAFSSCLSMF